MVDKEILPDDKERQSRLNSVVAISIAILAGFMAVTKVKDDNIVQAMLQAKTDAVDNWNAYQAKRIRHALLESSRDQILLQRTVAPAPIVKQLEDQLHRYEAEISRYKNEEADLQQQARAKEQQYETLNYRDDQFDLSDAALSLSVTILAVVALTGKRWLLWLSWSFAIFGLLIGTAGLLGWHLHPGWLTKLLS